MSRGRGFAPRNLPFTLRLSEHCVYLFRHLCISPHQGRKLTMNVFQFFLARYLNINP
nr:MAG TPA: hypothetical protein [Caudoviricetes sp.]